MQVYSMDDILVEIYNIRNISYIKLYDLVVAKSPKLLVIPSLLVFYDGNKHINLCSKDKYFSTFVKKVYQVYNDEKNNILEDSLTDPFKIYSGIEIDNNTKKILESGSLLEINDIYGFYKDKGYYSNSLLLEGDEFRGIIPILKYHIEDSFKNTDTKVMFRCDKDISGYREDYYTEVVVNGVLKQVFINYEKIDDNNYRIILSGLLDGNVFIDFLVTFKSDGIDINIKIEEYCLYSTYEYMITDNLIKFINIVNKDDKVVNYINRNLEECDCDGINIANIDEDVSLKWFLLPWGAYYGIDTKITNLTEVEKNVEIRNMYLSLYNDGFIRKDYYSKMYKRNSTSQVAGEVIVLDYLRKNIIGTRLFNSPNTFFVETSFMDIFNNNGYYDEYLRNKYFYHVIKASSVKEINRDNMVNVTDRDEVFNNGDILNKQLVLRLIGGK